MRHGSQATRDARRADDIISHKDGCGWIENGPPRLIGACPTAPAVMQFIVWVEPFDGPSVLPQGHGRCGSNKRSM